MCRNYCYGNNQSLFCTSFLLQCSFGLCTAQPDAICKEWTHKLNDEEHRRMEQLLSVG
jgi:hypothetical protein